MANLKDLIVQGNSNLIGDVQGKKFKVTNGTSSQFLKADGSLDSTTYLPSSSISGYVPTGRTITTTSGITGGGNLSANRTIGLEAVGTANTYGPTANVTGTEGTTIKIPQITTDAYGRVTAVTERTLTNKNTTYTAATAAPGKVATASASGTSTNYARQDHTHGIDLASGDSNGQVKIAGTNVTVKGINTAAYKAEGYFAGSGHTHDGTYAKSAFTKVMINSTALNADSTGDTLTITAGTFVSLTPDANNDKFTIGVSTGTSSSTLARGDHNHDSAYYKKAETYSKEELDDAHSVVAQALCDLNENKADSSDLDGIKLKKITQSDYNNLGTKDANTLYIIVD